jgi:Protein of unknown function (DUF1420)
MGKNNMIPRLFLSLAAVALLTGSSWTLGAAALSGIAFPGSRTYERAALRMTAGLGLTALLLSLAALAGRLAYAPVVTGVLAAIGAVLAAIDLRRTRETSTSAAAGAPWIRATWTAVLVCAAASCAGAIAPVTDDDALAYVVPIARHIAGSGTLQVWTDQARAMWPQSQHVLLAFVLRLGGDRLGAVTALEWLLCIGVVSALARRVCERPEHVGAALVIAFGAPVVAFQVSSAKEDLLLLAAGAATAFCLAGSGDIAELAAAGLFAGIAAGAKYPGAMIAAAAVLWPLIGRRAHRFRDAIVVALCAAASGGLWYGLNLWRYGNPIAPFVFGARTTLLDAATARDFVDGYGPGRGLLAFVVAPARIFFEPSAFGGRANLYNPLAYAGLAGLLAAPARRRSGPLFFMAAVFYAGWFFGTQNARLLLPAAVLLAPSAADRLVPIARRRPPFAALAWTVTALSLGVVAAVGTLRAVRYLRDPPGFLERETQNYADLQWMNTHLDRSHDRVASDHKVLAYLDVPSIFLAPTYQIEFRPDELNKPDLFLEACRRQGITHLFGGAESFPEVRDHLRVVYRNPSSRLGGVRFFREPPTEETAVFEIVYPPGRAAPAVLQ